MCYIFSRIFISLFKKLKIFASVCVYMCLCEVMHVPRSTLWCQRKTYRSGFSHSTTCLLESALRSEASATVAALYLLSHLLGLSSDCYNSLTSLTHDSLLFIFIPSYKSLFYSMSSCSTYKQNPEVFLFLFGWKITLNVMTLVKRNSHNTTSYLITTHSVSLKIFCLPMVFCNWKQLH